MAMRVKQEFHDSRHVASRAGERAAAGRFRHSAIALAIGALLGGSAGAYAGQPGQILPAGTIPQVRGVVYGQATVNAPVPVAGGNLLTIDQASQKTIIEWNSFDIARGSTVPVMSSWACPCLAFGGRYREGWVAERSIGWREGFFA